MLTRDDAVAVLAFVINKAIMKHCVVLLYVTAIFSISFANDKEHFFTITCNFYAEPWPIVLRVVADMCQRYEREIITADVYFDRVADNSWEIEQMVPHIGKMKRCPVSSMRHYFLGLYGRTNTSLPCLQVISFVLFLFNRVRLNVHNYVAIFNYLYIIMW